MKNERLSWLLITLVEFDCPKNQPKKLVFDLIGDGHHCGAITYRR